MKLAIVSNALMKVCKKFFFSRPHTSVGPPSRRAEMSTDSVDVITALSKGVGLGEGKSCSLN